ncbi:class D sortase [Halioglobus maricola]|uniref:Class D sortase n=1 Tax=Halioglobus maricola TaxID=2601894 RepID=A0A5P9NK49_9GAMM|nr:class D sortase [Halioglobus maricola]QFU76221.1 class D sortase [Halioglobus maricola]
MSVRPAVIRVGELSSYLAGIVLLGFFVVHLAQGEVERRGAIGAFEEQLAVAQASSVVAPPVPDAIQPNFADIGSEPDTTLWAPGRVADYQASLLESLPPVLGVLEVPSINLKVPVYQTNTELVMDRAAGVIDGMAYPHEPGNIGISGHRDGYFRALKDIKVGETIVLQTLEGEKRFRIDETHIVEIDDTRLLQDTRDQTITLVTCYPFYFVGHAPQRFIVTASLDEPYVNHN